MCQRAVYREESFVCLALETATKPPPRADVHVHAKSAVDVLAHRKCSSDAKVPARVRLASLHNPRTRQQQDMYPSKFVVSKGGARALQI